MVSQSQRNPPQSGPTLRLKNILVPTDFSPESLKAITYALAFAEQFGAVLSLVHVVEPVPVATGLESVPIVLDDTQLRQNAERRLTDLAKSHVPSAIAATPVVRYGSAFEEIISTAKARDIDLIIVATHGHTGLKRVFFGSTAERIVQRAPCPVLIVREREHDFLSSESIGKKPVPKLKSVLVPIDFSDCSKKALQYAGAFAAQFQAAILCLHVLEIPYGAGEAGIIVETESFRKRLHEETKNQMARFIEEQGAPVSEACAIQLGSPYREIIQTADQRAVDLIILGTHGRAGIGRFFLGSTTERVVRHAHCPVLVVREREREFVTGPDSGKASE